MERVSFLRAVVLVSILGFMEGSSSGTRVFVQKGKDVFLEVPTAFALENDEILTWLFNASNSLIIFIPGTESKIFDSYTGRVSVTNYSVTLKNLQAADSGVYDARLIGAKGRTIAEYIVTVQDPVSPVELKVDSVFSSSDSCIINATCRTADSDISSSFRCFNQTCDQDRGKQSQTTNSGASLRVYLSNGSIFCNHSNQISWTEDKREIQPLCKQHDEHPLDHNNNIAIWIAVVVSIIAVVIIIAVAVVCYRRKGKRYDTGNTENTIYATAQVETTQTRDENPPSDASCASPTSTYSLVGLHSRPAETRDNLLPESLYATVDKPAKMEKPDKIEKPAKIEKPDKIEKPARPCRNLQEL